MARGFSISDLLGQYEQETDKIDKVSVYDIEPSEDNFYLLSGIEELKASIIALGGVQQNIIVCEADENSGHVYKIIAGHRRAQACRELADEGYAEFETIPAVIKKSLDKTTEDALLIMTNSTQRELTDYEKVIQHMKLKELLPKLKKEKGLEGKIRDIEADSLKVSPAQIGIWNVIGTKLCPELMELFRDGEINISTAYEAAKYENQESLVNLYVDKGDLTVEDIKQLADHAPMPRQMAVDSIPMAAEHEDEPEKVPESGTSEEKPRTDTFEKIQACYSTRKDDIVTALDFIFCMNANEELLEELFEVFRSVEVNPEITAERIFCKAVPYEDDCIRVSMKNGYLVEYKHTQEAYIIPVYPFWNEFKHYFASRIGEKVPESGKNEVRIEIPEVREADDFADISEERADSIGDMLKDVPYLEELVKNDLFDLGWEIRKEEQQVAVLKQYGKERKHKIKVAAYKLLMNYLENR